jgi:DNA-binding SARP family transcriptional activator
MLARIILQHGHALSRESLAFTLFPDVDESAALAELRRYLYLANKALPDRAGDPWIVVDAETVRWNEAAGAFVDTVEFERLGADPETHSQAIELYAGDLLEDVYDDWVVSERERLRTLYLAILSESIERHRARRDFATAIGYAKRLLTVDPWREDAVRSLLALRYESGDAAGALSEFDRFAKRLRDELSIAPMPETLAVRDSILRNEAVPGSLSPAPAAVKERERHAATILPFVGRGRELALLRAAWGRAARGSSSLVTIVGEAGVGKTRLTAELARIAQSEGGRVFAGTTAAPESMPYQAIVEALRSALPLLLVRPPAPARRAALARVLPEMRDPEEAFEPEGSATGETARLFDALGHAVRTLASPRPLLLILEDVHWAGSASVDAIGAIVRESLRIPVLIVATCREEELPPEHPVRTLLRSLQAFAHAEELTLDRLAEDEVSELCARVDGLRDRGSDVAMRLFAHSEGNALFLNEAINAFLERDDTLDDAATSIAGTLESRIGRLDDDARTVAEIAAIAGPGCSIALVRDVSNLPPASIARGINTLLDRRILREAGARASYDYAFTHHLIASSVYDGIEPALRAQRHSRIARLLEVEYETNANASAREIARHHERAGDRARAGDWYLVAARQAAAVYAYADADELAARVLEHAPDPAVRAAALDVRERARGRRGDRAGQAHDIDELEGFAEGDPARTFDVLVKRILLARSLGDAEREDRLIDSLDALAESLDDAAKAHALMHRATHLGQCSRQAEGLAPALKAFEIYERLGDTGGQLECLYLLANFAANVGDMSASRRYLAQMSERAGSLADRTVEGRALDVAATAALLRQEYAVTFELTQRSLGLHLLTNDREGEAAARTRLAVTAAWLGDYATALREFDLGLETYESIGNKRGVAVTHTNRTLLLMRLGLLDEALESIQRSNELFDVVHEQRTVVANQVNASFVKLQQGEAQAAKALAAAALAGAKEIGFPVFEAGALSNLACAERALGETAAAVEHMEAAIALRRPLQEPADMVDDLADLTLTYVAAGKTAEAFETARELEALGSGSFDQAFWPHYVWWAVASGLAAGGESQRAQRAFARAREELERFAESIDDGRVRAAFRDLRVNRRIAAG